MPDLRQMGNLAQVVQSSRSFREVARRLGTNHHRAKRLVQEVGLDTDHFDFGRRSLSRVGQVFNMLTIEGVFKGPKGRWMCRCVCECGEETVKRLDGVVNSRVPSCGCLGRNRPSVLGANNPSFQGVGDIRGWHLGNIRQSAQRRNLEYKLSKKFLWGLYQSQGGRCALSGVSIVFGRVYFPHETTASLDRVDSAKGYIESNVQWVHKDINKIKRDIDQDYFIRLCQLVSTHQGRS